MAVVNRRRTAGVVVDGAAEADTGNTKVVDAEPGSLKDRRKLGLWEYIKSLSEVEAEQHMAYIYRILPSSGKGDDPVYTRREGEPAYIGLVRPPFDEEFLRKKYGGRILQVKLKDGNDDMVFDKRVRIEADPVLQEMEIVNPKRPTVQTSAIGAGAGEPAGVVGILERVLDDLKEAQKEGRQFDWREQLRGALDMQQEVFKGALKNLADGRPERGTSPMDMLTMKFMEKMLDRMDKPQPTTSGHPLMDKIIERALDRLLNEEGASTGKTSMADVLKLGIEKLPSILQQAASLAPRPPAGSPTRTVPATATVLPPVNPGPAAAGGGPTVIPVPGREPATAAAPEAPPSIVAPTGDQEQFYKELVIRMLADQDTGSECALVLDKLDVTSKVFAARLAQALKAGQLAELAADPVLSQAVQHPGWTEFAADFVKYFEPDEETAQVVQ